MKQNNYTEVSGLPFLNIYDKNVKKKPELRQNMKSQILAIQTLPRNKGVGWQFGFLHIYPENCNMISSHIYIYIYISLLLLGEI